jgi:hypothetical protein
MRVSIFVFPPAPKLSNLELNSYQPALTILNVVYLLKDESYPLKVHLQYTKCTSLNLLINVHATVSRCFPKICARRLPTVFRFRAGSLDVLAMLLHHTPRLENFHGLLSMSSYTVCPFFYISYFLSQLASSTRWPFHLTRYS